MAENENRPVEVNEIQPDEGNEVQVNERALPSREEILATSRKENKRGDERDVQENMRGMGFAYSVGILICGIVYLVNVLVEREHP